MAALQVAGEYGTVLVEVRRDEAAGGYPVRFRCVADCSRPLDHTEPLGDHPLGMLSRDREDLVYYLSSSGSAYQVRAWQLSPSGVRQVVSLSSRSQPDILSDDQGFTVIQLVEGDAGLLRPVRWRFVDGAFERMAAEGR